MPHLWRTSTSGPRPEALKADLVTACQGCAADASSFVWLISSCARRRFNWECDSTLARHHSVVQLLIFNSTRSKRASMSKHNPIAKAIKVEEDARWDACPIQWLHRRWTFFHATVGRLTAAYAEYDRWRALAVFSSPTIVLRLAERVFWASTGVHFQCLASSATADDKAF